MLALNKRIDNALSYIRGKSTLIPRIGLVLGSGLGEFVNDLDDVVCVPYCDIPDFPLSTVEGHEGAFVFGKFNGIPVVILRGRLHYYEGYSQQEITMPVRIMKKLGVEILVLTNAAGGINLEFSAGTLMLITDHINFSGNNPLIGSNLDEFGPRFPDVSDIYTKDLRIQVKEKASCEGIALNEGIYIMYSGPNYETAAEIRFFRAIGADAVGMSTVPEALVACHCGMKLIGISCITNMATGVLDKKLSHKEIFEIADKKKQDITKLIRIVIGIANSNLTP
ncbi:MAG: purine-nucleoside phosphorylase [Treponema sp.]|nr:purine-nucleoside phosphorylase [Treponema sp.]